MEDPALTEETTSPPSRTSVVQSGGEVPPPPDWWPIPVEEKHDPDPLPEPEVRAVEVEASDKRVPQGARNIIVPARRAGWTVKITFARGPIAHGTTREFLRMVDSIVVKGRRGTDNFVAEWLDGSAKSAYAGPDHQDAVRMSVTELKARLA